MLIAATGMLAVAAASAAVAVRTDRRLGARMAALTDVRRGPGSSLLRALDRLGHSRTGRAVQTLGGPRLARRLELAGEPWPPERVAAAKVGLAGGATLFVLALTHGGGAGLAASLPVGLFSFLFPDLLLARTGRSRQSLMELRVPDLVELLVATTEAGLAPPVALRRSADVVGGPLGEELRRSVGVPWRAAMDRMVARTEVASLRRLVEALARSNRLGTSVRGTLRAVSDELRTERRTRAEEAARRAPVKMLFPLVFLILPAFLLLTVGPVVLATVHSLRSG